MVTIAAAVGTGVLAGIVIFQILLAAGFAWGHLAWGGRHRVLPAKLRWGSAAAALLLAGAAWVLLARAGLVAHGAAPAAVRILTWFWAGFFLLNGLGNLASRHWMERAVMAPAAAVLAACFAAVAIAAP